MNDANTTLLQRMAVLANTYHRECERELYAYRDAKNDAPGLVMAVVDWSAPTTMTHCREAVLEIARALNLGPAVAQLGAAAPVLLLAQGTALLLGLPIAAPRRAGEMPS